MRARRTRTARGCAGEGGHVLLITVLAVAAAGILGVALFELGVIEAGLVARDVGDVQAFYCAEGQAAWLYNQYTPVLDASGTRGSETLPPLALALAGGTFTVRGTAVVDAAANTVTVTVTCALPDGRTRTVQRQGAREFLPPPFDNALTSMGFDCAGGACAQNLVGDLVLGGTGEPAQADGHAVGGRDRIQGDLYVAGWSFLRGQAQIDGFSPSDGQATITHFPGGGVVSQSPGFDPSVPGAVGQGGLAPLDTAATLDQIRGAITGPDGAPAMKGTWGGTTVYNLAEIFNQLGEVNEGNNERNLARPASCTFGVPSADAKCQIWQDLVVVGPRRTCAPTCADGVSGPKDQPSYYFMGMPRDPSVSPQRTSFASIFAAVVQASAELQQLGFVASSYTSLRSRLDVFFGSNPAGEGRVNRFVELTVGTDPETAAGMVRSAPPIFYVDGYWRADGGSSTAYNGRATVVATRSVILSDNMLYLGGLENTNLTLPPSTGACAPPAASRSACGLGDALGLVAQEDIWFGDPGPSGQTLHQVQAVMVAGRNANMFDYTPDGACCKGTDNALTLDGTLIAGRQVQMMRDWAYPGDDRAGPNQACTGADAGCRPVGFYRYDPANPLRPNPHCPEGQQACWLFMTVVNGALVPDPALYHKAFLGGCETAEPCQPNRRRITHFQLNVTYDRRLKTHAGLLPPGLPTGGGQPYANLARRAWRDCGADPSCS